MKKKTILRIIILPAVFIAAGVSSYLYLNHETGAGTVSQEDPTLPVVYAQYNGTEYNEMHGYTEAMSVTSMRDTVTPLDEDHDVTLVIDSYGETVDDCTFSVCTIDGESVLMEDEPADLSQSDDGYTAALSLTDGLSDDTAYVLTVTLDIGGESVYYYTRVSDYPDAYLDECLDFIQEIHAATLDENGESEIRSYLETDSSADESSLAYVTIENTAEQVCWADFSGEVTSELSVDIEEVYNSYSAFTMRYIMSEGSGEDAVSYEVEEYFRVRCMSGQMYLLDYERTAERIFAADSTQGSDTLKLGIRSEDVEYMSNDSGSTVCFVQNGNLWSFQPDGNQFTRIYGLSGTDSTDARTSYAEHDIHILRVYETGSVDFVVYGYMNSGRYEGQVGICVCYYDDVNNTIKERLFIPVDLSYQQMKEGIGSLMYISSDDMFYISDGTQVYQIDLNTQNMTTVIENMNSTYKISESGRFVAWTDESEGSKATELILTDLDTVTDYTISEGSTVYMKPLGFIGEDLVYGAANAEDLLTDSSGHTTFAMEHVNILDCEDENHTILKSCSKEGRFITRAVIDGGTMTLKCVKESDGKYVRAASISVQNNEVVSEETVTVSTTVSDEYENEVIIELLDSVSKVSASSLTPLLSAEEPDVQEIVFDTMSTDYYIYAKGGVYMAVEDPAEAVSTADETGGVVVDNAQHDIWNRAKPNSQDQLTVTGLRGKSDTQKAVNAMLSAMGISGVSVKSLLAEGYTPYQILEESAGSGIVMDLTGCSLDEVLYYVGHDHPVYSMLGDDPVLILGYDSASVTYYNVADGYSTTLVLDTAISVFEDAGDIYYAYWNN